MQVHRTGTRGSDRVLRLFCFPYAGGGASSYRGWQEHLPAGVGVRPVQLPGRESRWGEPLATTFSGLVDTLLSELKPQLGARFAFFGHSFGGLIAFELARRLRQRGLEAPVHLFISATQAPHVPSTEPPIHELSDAQFVDELIRRHNGIPEDVRRSSELLELVLPVIRSDFELYENHEHREEQPLDCPISVFGGSEDPRVGRKGLEAWAEHTTAPCRVLVLPGDHFFSFASESTRGLLRAISNDLLCAAPICK